MLSSVEKFPLSLYYVMLIFTLSFDSLLYMNFSPSKLLCGKRWIENCIYSCSCFMVKPTTVTWFLPRASWCGPLPAVSSLSRIHSFLSRCSMTSQKPWTLWRDRPRLHHRSFGKSWTFSTSSARFTQLQLKSSTAQKYTHYILI